MLKCWGLAYWIGEDYILKTQFIKKIFPNLSVKKCKYYPLKSNILETLFKEKLLNYYSFAKIRYYEKRNCKAGENGF